MKVGDSWSSQHQVTLHASSKVVPLTMNYRVEAYAKATVPAGSFNAYLVVSTGSNGEVQRLDRAGRPPERGQAHAVPPGHAPARGRASGGRADFPPIAAAIESKAGPALTRASLVLCMRL